MARVLKLHTEKPYKPGTAAPESRKHENLD